MRRSLAVFTLSALLAVCSCAERPLATASAPAVDRKLSTFVFLEEGKLVSFAVDARSTREREQGPFIPFEICVANRGVKSLTLTRESFTLIDQDGNRYPCVGPRDLLESYDFLDFDRRLAEVAGIVESRFSTYTRYPSSFSPVRTAVAGPFQSTLVRDALSLPQYGYIVDFLYFPKPKTGVLGRRFELFLEAPELQDPVFVKFVVK
jgi:hypothetical protein